MFLFSLKRLIIGLGSLAILSSFAVYIVLTQKSYFSHQSVEKETPHSLNRSEILALGRIEPEGEVIQVTAPSSSLTRTKIAELWVKEGDLVQASQIIAVLDTLDTKKSAVTVAQEQLKVFIANLEVIKAGAKQGAINAQKATIQRLKVQLQGAISTNKANIARLKAQLQGEKQSQTATIDRLKAELNNATTELKKRYEYLAQEGVISDSDLDQRRLAVTTTQEALKEAQAQLNTTVATLEQQITEAKAKAQENQRTLEAQIQEAQATLDNISEVRTVDVQKAEAEVQHMKANLKQAETDLDLAYVKAPISGRILKIQTHSGEEIGSNGIVLMGKTQQAMYTVAEVYETDISLVKIGQSATITSPAFSKPISGKVTHIGQLIYKNDVLGDDPAADSDARIVEVKIKLENDPQIAQFSNLQVDVRIQVNKNEAVK